MLNLGKLRFHRSGKITLRIVNPDNGSKITLLVNKGIQNSFYQEVANLPLAADGKQQVSFLSQIKDKLVVTPDFEKLLDL